MTFGPDDALAAHELDLVSSAAQGDEAAFDRFYERHAPSVQLLVERLLGPGPTADAVVVEAFEKTVRRLPLLGSRNSSPGLYLLSTARNGAYAALGRERPSADGGPLAALLSLPSRQRELLGLRELGLSEDAAAEVAGVDAAEVGVQVARARLRLTDQLEGTTLSSVFADERAERLLAAEVVRSGGAPLPSDLEQEITAHADEDARFAAALSAVRSPSRSVGQLPPVSGASRLAATARGGAVGRARPAASGTTASRPAIQPPAPAAPAPAAPAPPAASTPPAADPPRARRADPYDATIGDEAAWGIVDDDDHEPAPTGQPSGEPAVESPGEGEWEDGAGAVSAPGSVAASGFTPLAPRDPQSEAPARSGDPLADPFAGWDDVDWAEDEREWSAGPPAEGASPLDTPADGESAIVSVRPARTPADVVGEPTRAFDAVAAGLVDPEPPERVPVPPVAPDLDDLGLPPERRSRWRMVLIWILVVLVLFAGAALAAYAYVQATQDPAPPESKVTQSTPIAKTSVPAASTPKKKSSGSSSSSSANKSSSSAAKSSSSSSSSSSGSASSSSGGSTSSGTAAGTGSTRATTPRSTGTAGGGSGGTTKTTAPKEPSVTSGGAASSGGAVRGDGTTTP